MKKLYTLILTFLVIGSASAQTVRLQEDFEGVSFPSSWSRSQATGSTGWILSSGYTSQYWVVPPNTQFALSNDDACNCDMSLDYMTTPSIDLSNDTMVFLSFDVFYDGLWGSIANIDISDNGGASWNALTTLGPNPNWRNETIDVSAYAGGSVLIRFHHDDGGAWADGFAVDNVVVFVPDLYDVGLDAIVSPEPYEQTNTKIPVTADITNYGGATITSFDAFWTDNIGATQSATISGVSIAPLSNYQFDHPDSFEIAAAGPVDFKMWVGNVNGMGDSNAMNDTLERTVSMVDTLIQRLPFHESFTSSTCGPCLAGNQNTTAIWSANPDRQVILKYQMSWPGSGDPYYTDEGNERRNYYSINSVPQLWVDGQWGDNSQAYTAALRDGFYGVPSFMSVEIDYQVNCQQVDATVTVNPFADWPAGMVLHFAIMENKTFNNIKTNGETEFDNVMKKMLPDASGTVLPALVNGVPYTTNFSYTFNGSYRLPNSSLDPIDHATEHSVEEFFDLQVVAFVQNNSTLIVEQSAYGTDVIDQDVATTELLTPTDLFLNSAPFKIEAVVQNWQDSLLDNLDFNYQIDNGPVETVSLSGLGLEIGDTIHASHSSSWTPAAPGTYDLKVWISNPNGGTDQVPCNDTISTTLNVQLTGISGVIQSQISVFPNPSEGVFTIENNYSEDVQMVIIDPLGNAVREYDVRSGAELMLDLSQFPSGVYFAKMKTSQGEGTKKLILK